MPSLDDVFTELQNINSNLVQLFNGQAQVKASIDAGTVATNGVHTAVDATNSRLDVLILGQIYTNQVLFHLTQQTDTMICALEHISRNTCSALNEAHRQTGLVAGMRNDAADLLSIGRSAFPAGAVALDQAKDLRREIERCCPPTVEPPVCDYTPCPTVKPMEPPREQQPPPK